MASNFERTVAAMSAQDMELLIRAYIRRHVHATGERYTDHVNFRLTGECNRKDEFLDVKWHVYDGNGALDTKGERLDAVMVEFFRRKGWSESSAASLLLIESSIVPDEAI